MSLYFCTGVLVIFCFMQLKSCACSGLSIWRIFSWVSSCRPCFASLRDYLLRKLTIPKNIISPWHLMVVACSGSLESHHLQVSIIYEDSAINMLSWTCTGLYQGSASGCQVSLRKSFKYWSASELYDFLSQMIMSSDYATCELMLTIDGIQFTVDCISCYGKSKRHPCEPQTSKCVVERWHIVRGFIKFSIPITVKATVIKTLA